MEPLSNILIFLIGLSVLIFSTNWLVQGCVKFSYVLKLTPLFIGVVLVAFGTSAPEAAVSIVAASTGQDSIALGNILGSNIANIGLILGLCAIIKTLIIRDKTIFRREVPVMLLSAILLYGLSLDLLISRLDGLILLLLFIVFCIISYKSAKKSFNYEEIEDFKFSKSAQNITSRPVIISIVTVSLIGIIFGAHLMVTGGVNLARIFGLSPWIIGIIPIAIGTSLPELSASLVALLKKIPSISIGNIIGSNIFNILFVLGVASLIKPITLEPPVLRFEFPVMLLFTFSLLMTMKTEYKITRIEGIFMFLGYVGFIILLIKFS